MPRRPDPDLEDRILDAAHALWKRGGEKALTMRAVARAADSNTPAVYRRFKNRRDIVRALLRRIQVDIGSHLLRCRTVEEMGESYLDYALSHRHEYELFYAHARDLVPAARTGRRRPIRESRPNLGLMEKRLAERLGGPPRKHTGLALALWASAHGTAMMLISEVIPGHDAAVRKAFTAAVRALMHGALSKSKSSTK
jgi:AcrR family transcriptional regulator